MGRGTRASTACARCYKRKKRCSRGYPTCSECAQAGVPCIGLDRGTEAELPRSLVSYLEDTVAQLELERLRYGLASVSDHRSEPMDQGSVEAPRTITSTADSVDFPTLYTFAVHSASTTLPFTSKNNNGEMLPYYRALFMGAELPYPLAFTVQRPPHIPIGNASNDFTKLPAEVLDALFSTYTDRIVPQFPVFSKDEVLLLQQKYIGAAGNSALISPIEQFIVSMILAISVLSSRSKDYRKLVSLAESLRRDAFARVGFGSHISPVSVTSIQQLLLIAHYGFLLPSSTNLWQVTGDAMRIALELGLHQEVPAHCGLDQTTIEFRRRLFWVLFCIERSVAITSHRPYAVAGDQIGIAPPDLSDTRSVFENGITPGSYISFNDRIRVLKIQSELCSINIGKRALATSGSSYDRWMNDMEIRIRELTQTEHTKGFELMAWQCVILLHMPCARNPDPTPSSILKGFNAAVQLTTLYWELVQSDYVDYPWHGVHKCYEAGMLILYHLWFFPQHIREQYTTRQVFEVVNQLSGLFILVARQWPAAQQCSSLFDRFRKGALAAFREEETVDLDQSPEAKQLRDIVFRENANLLYAHEETQAKGTTASADAFLPFEQFDFSLDFPDTTFLDFFDTSEVPSDLPSTNSESDNRYSSVDLSDVPPHMALDHANMIPPAKSTIPIDQDQIEKAMKNLAVCAPCKKRRIKCDMLLPSCRNCTKLQKDCKYFDNALMQDVPRKHIHALRQQIHHLTRELESIQAPPPPFSTTGASPLNQTQGTPAFRSIWPAPIEPAKNECSTGILCPLAPAIDVNAIFFGATSAFARLLTLRPSLPSAILPPAPPESKYQSLADMFLSSMEIRADDKLPREVAEELARLYYQSIEICLPILGQPLIQETLAAIFTDPMEAHDDITAKVRYRLILSIALSLLKAQDERLGVAANTCFRQAISIGSASDIFVCPTSSALQLVLLMSIYTWINPDAHNIWRLLGHASRMCLDITEMHGSDKTESAKSETLYRTLYTLETHVATAYGRPRQLPCGKDIPFTALEQSLPSADDPSRLMYNLARLQNRFHRDLIESGTVTATPDDSIPRSAEFSWMDGCVLDIYSWLETWRASITNLGTISMTNGMVDSMLLLQWGQFQQAETLLLAKAASDRRGKMIISRQEEYNLCKRLLRAAESLHQQRVGLGPTSLSPSNYPLLILPVSWTWAHSVFTAGAILIQHSASHPLPNAEDQNLIKSCLGLLASFEMSSERSCKGLTNCIQGMYDSHHLLKCINGI